MARYWNEMSYSQPTEEKLKENAKQTAEKAAAKGKMLHPIVITSRQIAKSWWGKSWCENLERYADYEHAYQEADVMCVRVQLWICR